MIFPVNSDKLNGTLRSYKTKGTPSIQLIPSSTAATAYSVNNILDYNSADSHWASDASQGFDANLVVKFVDDRFLATHYSIRSHPSSNCYMQAWTLEGSTDNVNYETLHNKTQNDDLINSGIGQYKINPRKKGFRYFRIKQTMKTLLDHENMRISGLDFFGVYPFECQCQNTCRLAQRHHVYLLFCVLIMSSS